ncbi:MAG TPA: patatin-like phospholipase family protein [Verrucomicrobiae bacterium]|nr:patatin-like phospholipase family protein [Verrucomicrobiae bacterium]
MYRILSFDGGGIRGLVTLAMLKKIQDAAPRLISQADLVAGTSTGGIIALGLAAGKTVDELISLYLDNGDKIFDDSWLDNIIDLGGISGADYDQVNLKKILENSFGSLKLEGLAKKVLIPSFDLDNDHEDPKKRTWKPIFFHNFPGDDSDGDETLVDVALCTSAAPTYFPSHNGYVDGGVVANNPSMAALTQTQDPRAELNPRPALGDIRMLSLGTGTILSYIKGKSHDWGYAQWVKPLINLLTDASMGIADYQCRQILREGYHRLAPVFPPKVNIMMDEWKRSKELIEFGNSADVAPAVQWLQKVGW